MLHNRFDHLAKQIGKEALGPCGITVVNGPINPETQYADLRHEPDPARQAERDRLGLLGRLAAYCCVIEVYSRAPSAEEFRACLTKHFASWQERARKARSDNRKRNEQQLPPEAFADSFLWIITAGAPATLLTKLALTPAPDWPAGVYHFGGDVLRVGVIVASELPRDRTTLLVRLMAAGPLLPQAIAEVATLPPDAHERSVAEPVLLQLQYALGQTSSRTPDEQEFIMAMYKTWEEGRTEARTEGSIKTSADAVLTVLHVRGIAVPETVRERILAQNDLAQLKRWLEKAVVASSIADVIGDLRGRTDLLEGRHFG
jgi:hypothetical protein